MIENILRKMIIQKDNYDSNFKYLSYITLECCYVVHLSVKNHISEDGWLTT